MPSFLAADVLGVSQADALAIQARIAGASAMNAGKTFLSYSAVVFTKQCDPKLEECPRQFPDTKGADFPALVYMKEAGNTRTFDHIPGGHPCDGGAAPPPYGAVAWDVTASNGMASLLYSAKASRGGSAGQGMSGQLVELTPGGSRPPVWNLNADAVLFVIEGYIELSIYQGDVFTGFSPQDSFEIPAANQTKRIRLGPNQAAYVPMNMVYYYTEVECGNAAVTIGFSHPEWEEIDMKESLRAIAKYQVDASLNAP